MIGKGAQWTDGTTVTERRNLAVQDKPKPLIPRELIVGVKERIDSFGNIVRPLDEKDVREKVRYLINKGVRGFVVSLLFSPVNPVHERRIREIIREEFKEYYLGYLPVVLSNEVVGRIGEYERTMTAILDAYLHASMQMELSAMWDRLREFGYNGPFMLIHNTGGMAEVFKTDAVKTYNAGPVSALIGGYHVGNQLGFKNIVVSDVGGTSFDIGLVVEADVRNYEFRPIIDRWLVAMTMLQSMSIGAGGGSIAWINEVLGTLEVGPQSAGAYPGPVCYDFGGTEPTVTDANLLLGYLNPRFYFGGRMKLNIEKAKKAIKEKIGDQLGMDVIEAAYAIRKIVDNNMGAAIRKQIHLRGFNPEEFVIFALGGGGPTHVAGYMQEIPKAIIFPTSPVFSAWGSSVMDISHIYELSRKIKLVEPITQEPLRNFDEFNSIVNNLMEKAKMDLEGEGLPIDQAIFSLELDMLYGGQVQRKRVSSPVLFIKSKEDIEAICEECDKEFSEAFSPLVVNRPGGVFVENFVLTVRIPTQKPKLPEYEIESQDPSKALKGKRDVYWGNEGFLETNVYNFDMLKSGNVIEGPAIIEAEYTTVVVPPDFVFSINRHGLGELKRR